MTIVAKAWDLHVDHILEVCVLPLVWHVSAVFLSHGKIYFPMPSSALVTKSCVRYPLRQRKVTAPSPPLLLLKCASAIRFHEKRTWQWSEKV